MPIWHNRSMDDPKSTRPAWSLNADDVIIDHGRPSRIVSLFLVATDADEDLSMFPTRNNDSKQWIDCLLQDNETGAYYRGRYQANEGIQVLPPDKL